MSREHAKMWGSCKHCADDVSSYLLLGYCVGRTHTCEVWNIVCSSTRASLGRSGPVPVILSEARPHSPRPPSSVGEAQDDLI